jgi:predicted Ser/Thr protein kinase
MTFEKAFSILDNVKYKECAPIGFSDFLKKTVEEPQIVFRNISQMFFDMIHYYVPEGVDEYPDDPESIGFIDYDFSKLFVKDISDPFFADRVFSNRFMGLVEGFKKGLQDNTILLFEGSTGSGKSCFLNNLLYKFEKFTKFPEGMMYETFWKIDIDKFGGFSHFPQDQMENKDISKMPFPDKYLGIPCPSHDHPILQIPKNSRREFLEKLIVDEEFKKKLFEEKEYEWIFKNESCTICSSIYHKLLEKLGDANKVFEMLYPRKYQFSKRRGEGITIFNPGDLVENKPNANPFLQYMMNCLFKDSNPIQYLFSNLAKTNNGIFALMDIKENNCQRFKDLHGIISEGVHKIKNLEENINSLFVGLINPEDSKIYEDEPSLKDRIHKVLVPYVLDYNTEAQIYKSKFSKDISSHFLPRVFENFAKIIVASRLNPDSKALKAWIKNPKQYDNFLDKDQLLLKMDIYSGHIPTWLSEEDRAKFKYEVRKKIISESELEGVEGFTGRESLTLFDDFLSRYIKPDTLITMDNVYSFFETKSEILGEKIPDEFLESILTLYEFNILQEVKESLYFYNEKKISREIQNYLYSINLKIGTKEQCPFTGDSLEITDNYLETIEKILVNESSATVIKDFRKEMQKTYVSQTLATEMNVEQKTLLETEQYQFLFNKYSQNIKENVLIPFMDNDNFRSAIQDYKKESFNKYDKKIKQEVKLLIQNLQKKFNYSEKGAKQISLYVLDEELAANY